MTTGVNLVHVPYRGSAPAADRPARRAGAGDVRQLAVLDRACAERQAARAGRNHRDALSGIADIPTVGDFVPGFEASVWQGIGAPKGTPPGIVEKLNQEINAALADPKVTGATRQFGWHKRLLCRLPSSGLLSSKKRRNGPM